MKEVDDTPVGESESEIDIETICALLYPQVAAFMEIEMHALQNRVAALEAEVADLHHRRRVSRQQTVNQDPEWY